MKAKIIVMPKKTVLDPQGKTVQHALESLGFKGIQEVRIGKFIEVELKGGNKAALKKKMDEACHKILSNPVIEDYEFSSRSPSGVKESTPSPRRCVMMGAASQRVLASLSPHWPKMTKCLPGFVAVYCSNNQVPL